MTYSDESVNILTNMSIKITCHHPNFIIYIFILSHPHATSGDPTSRAKRNRGDPLEDRAGKSGSTSESQPASGRNFAGWKS